MNQLNVMEKILMLRVAGYTK